jgi:hypothetical protein
MAYSYGSQDPAQSPAAAAAQQSEPEANASDKSRSIFRAIYQKATAVAWAVVRVRKNDGTDD